MYTTSRACVACRREHPGAHDRGCLAFPHPHVTKGTPPAIGVDRWWLAPPPEAAGRLTDRLLLAEAMSAATWETRTEATVPTAINSLSACLEGNFWHLAAWTAPTSPTVMAPYELLGLRHGPRFGSSTRVFWLAGHHGVAHVLAIDLTRERDAASRGGDSNVAAAA